MEYNPKEKWNANVILHTVPGTAALYGVNNKHTIRPPASLVKGNLVNLPMVNPHLVGENCFRKPPMFL